MFCIILYWMKINHYNFNYFTSEMGIQTSQSSAHKQKLVTNRYNNKNKLNLLPCLETQAIHQKFPYWAFTSVNAVQLNSFWHSFSLKWRWRAWFPQIVNEHYLSSSIPCEKFCRFRATPELYIVIFLTENQIISKTAGGNSTDH